MNYRDHKNLDIHAISEEYIFIAEEVGDKWVTVETDIYKQESSMCIWKDIYEMIDGITWHEWIKEGVNNRGIQYTRCHTCSCLVIANNGTYYCSYCGTYISRTS